MGWSAAILGALKALPEIVGVIRDLGDKLEALQMARIDSKYNKLKEDVNVFTKRIEAATNNDERRTLVAQLNSIVSR